MVQCKPLRSVNGEVLVPAQLQRPLLAARLMPPLPQPNARAGLNLPRCFADINLTPHLPL